tara:strand:+ start:152 stop:853 length:702 start_codon:yes stop_codon:yes gene_type:complete
MTSASFENGLTPLPEEKYNGVGMNQLVTYAVYTLEKEKTEVTTEDIVVACFRLFPKKFSLRGYPEWPDSAVVNKRWVDCRSKKLISGSTASGFKLTTKGLKNAEETERLLTNGAITNQKIKAETRTRAGKFMRSLENSDAYLTYKDKGSIAEISELGFRNMLLGTMETPAENLNSNFEQMIEYATFCERNDLLEFLSVCKAHFKKLLFENVSSPNILKGGMLPKKSTRKGARK